MKILIVSDTYYPHINGVYYFIQRLAERIQANGHEVAVMAPSVSFVCTDSMVQGIRVFGVSSIPLFTHSTLRIPIPIALKAKVDKVFNNFSPDILHLQNHFSLNKAALAVSKKYVIPVIGTNHFMTENFTPFYCFLGMNERIEKIMWAAFSKVFNQLDLVTTPTETGAKMIRPKLRVKVTAVSNGIDFTAFNTVTSNTNIRDKYGLPDKPILLFVGRLDPEKHIDEVLSAVARLSNTDFCFVVTGKGTIKPVLEKLIKKLGIEDRVIFTGFVCNEDLPELYRISKCYITASVAELQSIATMEAMACGLPVIAANAGALAELVHHNKNGFLFTPGDIDTLSQSIHTIFTNNEMWQKMRKTSLEIIKEHDINNTISTFENLYKNYSGIKKQPALQLLLAT